MSKTFICIGDAHFPFVNRDSLYGRNGIITAIKELKPHYVIQLGDLYDFYSWSKFPFKRDVLTPESEIKIGRENAEYMWKRVQKASPKSKCFQIRGNHDERPIKRLLERSPEMHSIYQSAHDQLFDFPKVEAIGDDRENLILHNIRFMHGFRSKLGDHAKHNAMSTVCGHSHTGGCQFLRVGDRTIWELNVGYIADPRSVPMSYTRQRTVSKWTQGFGIIDNKGPRFIPLKNVSL